MVVPNDRAPLHANPVGGEHSDDHHQRGNGSRNQSEDDYGLLH
jgi:hypothetical protein